MHYQTVVLHEVQAETFANIPNLPESSEEHTPPPQTLKMYNSAHSIPH